MPTVTGIAVGRNINNSVELVATSAPARSGDAIWHDWQIDPERDDWSGWQPFGKLGGGMCAPTVVDTQCAPLEVCVLGRDGSVWRRRQSDPNSRSDWFSLGTPARSSVSQRW
jgi:hypothetical protein